MKSPRMLRYYAHPQKLSGPILEAALKGVAIGEVCEIRKNIEDTEIVARAQVIGFNREMTVLSLMGKSKGLSREAVLMPTGSSLAVWISNDMLGSVVDPSGKIVERLSQSHTTGGEMLSVDTVPPSYIDRESIREPLETGVRAIDGLLTCGIGQRIGIFASAGCGKTMLMNMLIEHGNADVFVLGLIGERGREVTEFTDYLRQSTKRKNCVLVYATSDFSSVDRSNAALLATTVAEYFRSQGKRVVLFLDSITRYARALRDVSLSAGEPPARRGYPASVFDSLPHLLERPGLTNQGSITAFYTVLLEGDDEPDPIADEIRSILDGHIYLNRKLAAQGHFPAIDVLRSASRVATHVTTRDHQTLAYEVRGLMARLEELQMLLDMGEYKPGENTENDRAVKAKEKLKKFLRQSYDEGSTLEKAIGEMHELVK